MRLAVIKHSALIRQIRQGCKMGWYFYGIVEVVFGFMLIVLILDSQRIGACSLGRIQDKEVSKILICPNMLKPLGIITSGYPAESSGKIERIDLPQSDLPWKICQDFAKEKQNSLVIYLWIKFKLCKGQLIESSGDVSWKFRINYRSSLDKEI